MGTAGSQQPGPTPQGSTRVFGPLTIVKTRIEAFADSLPEIPDIDLSSLNMACSGTLAAVGYAQDMLSKAIELPAEICATARMVLDSAIDEAQAELMKKATKIFDEVSEKISEYADQIASEIEDALSEFGGMLPDIDIGIDLGSAGKALQMISGALEGLMDCPFIADMPIAKEAAGILDILDDPYSFVSGTVQGASPFRAGARERSTASSKISGALSGMLGKVGDQLKTAGLEQINALKKIPQGALGNIQGLMDDVIARSGISGMVSMLDDVASCIGGACKGAQNADAAGKLFPKTTEKILDKANMAVEKAADGITGKVVAEVAKPVNAAQEKAAEYGKELFPFTKCEPKI